MGGPAHLSLGRNLSLMFLPKLNFSFFSKSHANRILAITLHQPAVIVIIM
jgi:hypothetical protein